MIRAGGVIFLSLKTKRICLFLRSNSVSNPHTWANVGGKIENEEKILIGVSREVREECGFLPKYKKVIPIDVFQSMDGNFIYHSFIVLVDNEFTPKLNSENNGYGWFDLNGLPKPLHQGTKKILLNKNFKKIFKEIIEDYS